MSVWCGCVLVPSVGDRNRKSWRLLVEEGIAKIQWFYFLIFFLIFGSVLVNHPSLQSGSGCWSWWQLTGGMWHVTCDMWYMTHEIGHMTCYAWSIYIFFVCIAASIQEDKGLPYQTAKFKFLRKWNFPWSDWYGKFINDNPLKKVLLRIMEILSCKMSKTAMIHPPRFSDGEKGKLIREAIPRKNLFTFGFFPKGLGTR